MILSGSKHEVIKITDAIARYRAKFDNEKYCRFDYLFQAHAGMESFQFIDQISTSGLIYGDLHNAKDKSVE